MSSIRLGSPYRPGNRYTAGRSSDIDPEITLSCRFSALIGDPAGLRSPRSTTRESRDGQAGVRTLEQVDSAGPLGRGAPDRRADGGEADRRREERQRRLAARRRRGHQGLRAPGEFPVRRHRARGHRLRARRWHHPGRHRQGHPGRRRDGPGRRGHRRDRRPGAGQGRPGAADPGADQGGFGRLGQARRRGRRAEGHHGYGYGRAQHPVRPGRPPPRRTAPRPSRASTAPCSTRRWRSWRSFC